MNANGLVHYYWTTYKIIKVKKKRNLETCGKLLLNKAVSRTLHLYLNCTSRRLTNVDKDDSSTYMIEHDTVKATHICSRTGTVLKYDNNVVWYAVSVTGTVSKCLRSHWYVVDGNDNYR